QSSLLQISGHLSLSLSLSHSAYTIFVTEQAKKDTIRKAACMSDLLVDAVNGGVEECFINEKRIELEIRALAATVTQFIKQTDHAQMVFMYIFFCIFFNLYTFYRHLLCGFSLELYLTIL
ncbi:GCN5L1 domain-containing protein, partial [Cephalotus follicularis]